jgi:hypothetical protein
MAKQTIERPDFIWDEDKKKKFSIFDVALFLIETKDGVTKAIALVENRPLTLKTCATEDEAREFIDSLT